MSIFGKLFKGKEKEEEKPVENNEPALSWIGPADNPWGITVLDLRPITTTMLSTSKDPRMAENAVSYSSEDGIVFIGEQPYDKTIIGADIRIPVDGILAPGVLFIPSEMENKWAIYFHNDTLIFIRSWLRQVFVTATTRQENNQLIVESIQGKFTADEEEPAFTKAVLRYLLINYCIREVVPAPLPEFMKENTRDAALWAFSNYGNMALAGTFDTSFIPAVNKPLRSHSLLHISVARGDLKGITQYILAGIPLNYLASDGLAPLHWAVAAADTAPMDLLLQAGADPDTRSAEGATALMNAVQSNKVALVTLLLKSKADVNAKDYRGFTALHRAAEIGHDEIVRLLLENGADKTIEAEEHTALSLAKIREREDIIRQLS